MMRKYGVIVRVYFHMKGPGQQADSNSWTPPLLRTLLKSLPLYPLVINREGVSSSFAGVQNKVLLLWQR